MRLGPKNAVVGAHVRQEALDCGIRVAEYMTELPSRRALERKLHEAIAAACERLAAQQKQLGKDSA